jgi:hypothetical protein
MQNILICRAIIYHGDKDMGKTKVEKKAKKEPKWIKIKNANGAVVAQYFISDRIEFPQSKPNKILSFQKMEFKGQQPEYRIAYYNLQNENSTKRTFGRFVTNVPKSDMQKLIKEAQAKGWF